MTDVQGRCPACHRHSLFLGNGGHVTCSRLECPNPTAADRLLHAEPDPAPTQATEPASLRDQIAHDLREHGMVHLGDQAPADEYDCCADTVVNTVTKHLDIGDEQAWCKYCRRAWDSPRHRCESDAEQRVYGIAELRDRWLMAGAPPLGTSINRWWDKRLVELNAALDERPGTHRYLSTGCWHGDHAYCQSMTGLNGAKRPGECKFCQAACQCGCHGETAQPDPA